jgi:chemotaxis-related protein WspB
VLFLLFHLDEDCYALPAAQIAEVLPLLQPKRVPQAPAAVAGIIDCRGTTVPVVDLCQLALGRPARRRFSTRIILVRQRDPGGAGAGRLLGLIVERATRTFSCDPAGFEQSGLSNTQARYLGPIVRSPGGLVQRIEIDELLTPELCTLLFEPMLDRPWL